MANAIEILINARDNASATIDRASVSVGSLAKGVLASVGAFAAIDAAMRSLQSVAVGAANEFANEVEQLDRLSYVTGLSNEQLQIFRRGLERAGLDANQLGLAMRFFQNQLATNQKELSRYGITATDTFTALQQLKRALEGAGNETERTELAARTLGMRNVEVAQTVTQIADSYDREYAEALSRGAVMTVDMQAKMRALDDATDDFADTVRGLKIELADMFGPFLAAGLRALTFLNQIKGTLANLLPPQLQVALGAIGMLARGGGAGVSAEFASGRYVHGSVQPGALPAAPPAWSLGMSTQLPGTAESILSGRSFGTGNETIGRREDIAEPYIQLGKVLKENEGSANAFRDALSNLEITVNQAAFGISTSVSSAIMSLVTGAQSLGQAFTQLIRDIFRSIAEAIADYLGQQVAGWIVTGVGALVGGPTGTAIGKIGGAIRGSSMAPAGGNTFILQSIDSKSVLDSLVSPTGSMRRANDRVREVALAGSL